MRNRSDADLPNDDEVALFLQACQERPADMARDVLPDGDRRDFTVDVRTAVGEVIYTATLSLVGRWLKGLDKQADQESPAYDATASDGRAARTGECGVIATLPPTGLPR